MAVLALLDKGMGYHDLPEWSPNRWEPERTSPKPHSEIGVSEISAGGYTGRGGFRETTKSPLSFVSHLHPACSDDSKRNLETFVGRRPFCNLNFILLFFSISLTAPQVFGTVVTQCRDGVEASKNLEEDGIGQGSYKDTGHR